MIDRIFALHRVDLLMAVQLADQLAQVPGRGLARPIVTVIDPVMHHYAITQGLADVQLMVLPDLDLTLGGGSWSLAATRTVSAAVDEELAKLVPEARGAGWLGHWLRQLHAVVFGFRQVGRALTPRVAGERVHLLLPDLPHRYGYHSFVPALIVQVALRGAGQAPTLYKSPQPPWPATVLPDALHDDRAAGDVSTAAPVDLLCHLPTCVYDEALFANEVRASGRAALLLPSQLYDVAAEALPRTRMETPQRLLDRLPAGQRDALAAMLDRLGGVLAAHLAPLLGTPALVQSQVSAMVDACRDNALVFFMLEQRFATQPPRSLLISNHDTGQHGGLLSFARRHGLQTMMVPHSKIFNHTLLSSGHDVTCLTHPVQGGEVHDLDGSRMPTGVLDFNDDLQIKAAPPRPLATLGIVLNGLAATAICIVDLRLYLQGLAALRQWCEEHGVRCRIRCRPNESAASTVAIELGIPEATLLEDQQGSMIAFANGCDLVLGYDQPTSGAIEILRHGLPMMQVLCRRLAPEEWRIVDTGIVPQLAVDAVLERLSTFHADPLALWQFRRAQLADFVAAGRDARPLRYWLGQVAPADARPS